MRHQPIRNFILTCTLAIPMFAGPSTPGIENFHQVDAHVFRGAQPSGEGYQYLAKLGVKTVIDLRESDARARKEEQQVIAAGMKYVNVPMTGLTPPTGQEIAKILDLMENEHEGAVFVHCKRGADRTGAVIASYRIDHDGWDNARALSEAKIDGIRFSQHPRQDYIRTFQARKLEATTSSSPIVAQPAVAQPVVAQASVAQ
jgi:tyrosine-protein phosphatase SIW14